MLVGFAEFMSLSTPELVQLGNILRSFGYEFNNLNELIEFELQQDNSSPEVRKYNSMNEKDKNNYKQYLANFIKLSVLLSTYIIEFYIFKSQTNFLTSAEMTMNQAEFLQSIVKCFLFMCDIIEVAIANKEILAFISGVVPTIIGRIKNKFKNKDGTPHTSSGAIMGMTYATIFYTAVSIGEKYKNIIISPRSKTASYASYVFNSIFRNTKENLLQISTNLDLAMLLIAKLNRASHGLIGGIFLSNRCLSEMLTKGMTYIGIGFYSLTFVLTGKARSIVMKLIKSSLDNWMKKANKKRAILPTENMQPRTRANKKRAILPTENMQPRTRGRTQSMPTRSKPRSLPTRSKPQSMPNRSKPRSLPNNTSPKQPPIKKRRTGIQSSQSTSENSLS